MSRLLLLRCDASPEIGTGHAMRCLALAQAWIASGGTAQFVSETLTDSVRQRLADEGIDVVSAMPENAAAVVVDGYPFDDAYESTLPGPLLAIDDYGHAKHLNADFVLNQNLYATNDLYPNTNARLLLGGRYALLRREFWSPPPRNPEPNHILLTLGGAATDAELQSVRDRIPAHYKITVAKNVTDMPALMATADLAVTAGGSTCWELALMRVPMVVLVLAENQRRVAESVEQHGLGIYPSSLDDLGVAIAKARTLEPKTTIDGRGAHRVVMHLRAAALGIRNATLEDARMIWEWANDPLVRAVSFNSDPIPWESHLAWFTRRLESGSSRFFIGLDRGEPIGQIRFELDTPEEATISVSLGPAARGKGHGSVLIWRASQELFETSSPAMIHAYVKHDNDASLRAFAKAGYRKTGTKPINGSEAAHFVLTREDL